jgi:UDP-sugar diphosphatase
MSNKKFTHSFSNFEIVKLTESRYLNPYRVKYIHNNQNRAWDGILSHASVSCILYHTEKKSIILVRQFRPVVYVNQLIESHELTNTQTTNEENIIGNLDWSRVDPLDAITYELCAGKCYSILNIRYVKINLFLSRNL